MIQYFQLLFNLNSVLALLEEIAAERKSRKVANFISLKCELKHARI